MVGFISEDEFEFESSSSLTRRKRPHRHASYQTLRLEAFFQECRHPSERQRRQLGRELGLTPTQVKFWFQNKRTLVKVRNERVEGNALRAENERLKLENLAIREVLKDDLCTPCKGLPFNKEGRQWILDQLRMENGQLNEKYEILCNLLGNMGLSVAEVHSKPLVSGSPLDSSARSQICAGQRIGRLPIDRDVGSRNLVGSPLSYQLKEVQEPADKLHLIQAVVNAIDELTSLLVVEPLWIKDPTDGRYVIHRDNYERTFPRTYNHLKLKGSRVRFESSKEEGIVRMNGAKLVTMLMDSVCFALSYSSRTH
ncbi:hypothetical protein U1Q18_030346 [Sarracenia purpurea var. burkii]